MTDPLPTPDALCVLGNQALSAKRPDEAVALYRRALALDPHHVVVRKNLALALRSAQHYDEAAAILRGLLAERPNDAFLHNQLGKVYVLAQEFAAALTAFEAAAALDPKDADSLYWIGGVRHSLGELAAAEADYARAARVAPLIRRPARQEPPTFKVLLLCAPVAANTPITYLTDDAAYEASILLLFENIRPDVARLRAEHHLVVNLVSDPDQAGRLLDGAADLVARIGLPVVNPPSAVAQTTRDAMARRLSALPGACVPRTLRVSRGADPAAAAAAAGLPFPLLVRPAGTHGGEAFERAEDAATLEAQVKQHPGADHYLIEPIDYASADGFFRKYRFIVIGEAILQYHLAIGSHWKVHHATTDMINQAWMQREEAAFLADPGRVFSPDNVAALQAIRAAIGLDVFGIDCGREPQGRLVVFEVNTSMLVHPHNADFPYKIPHVEVIKRAFDAFLARRAAR